MSLTNYFLESGSELDNGRYKITGVLQSTDFSITYKAEYYETIQTKGKLSRKYNIDKIPVAIKELFLFGRCRRIKSNSIALEPFLSLEDFLSFKNSFLNEAQQLSRINEIPQIAAITDCFEENNTVYAVRPFVKGKSLKQLLKDGGKMTEKNIINYFSEIAWALGQIHDLGIFHKNLKPDNIILTPEGYPVILDFLEQRINLIDDFSFSTRLEETNYFAPFELYTKNRKIGNYTDIYSLGAIIFYCVTGSKPESVLERYKSKPLIAPGASSEINVIITKATAFNELDRFRSCTEFVEELQRCKKSMHRVHKKLKLMMTFLKTRY